MPETTVDLRTVDPGAAPLVLAELHATLQIDDAVVVIAAATSDDDDGQPHDHDLGTATGRGRDGHRSWTAQQLDDVLVGAGFADVAIDPGGDDSPGPGHHVAHAKRARSLADTVGPDMGLLVVGLNPSLNAADAGIGFFKNGNRYWPAALAAGLVTADRDPRDALVRHGIGMTDIAKRATARADELDADEFRHGMERLERLVRWLQPGSVCFVGLVGWRTAVDRTAKAGVQPGTVGDRPVYVMPSTSGLNARTSLDDLTAHLRAAAELAATS